MAIILAGLLSVIPRDIPNNISDFRFLALRFLTHRLNYLTTRRAGSRLSGLPDTVGIGVDLADRVRIEESFPKEGTGWRRKQEQRRKL